MTMIDEYIENLEKADVGSRDTSIASIVKETVSVFSGCIPEIKKGLDAYRGRVGTIGTVFYYDNKGDVKKLIGKLRLYQESHSAERTENAEASNSVTVIQNASPQISQTQSVAVSISIAQAIEAVEHDDLKEDDLKEIKALLLDAQMSKGDESKLKAVGKKIADFAFDKAVSSLPALLSFVAGLFQRSRP